MPVDPLSASAKRATQRHLQSAADALNMMDAKTQRQPSFIRIVECLKSGRPVDGYDGERLEEFARIQGIDYDPLAPRCPWTDLSVRAPLAAGLGGSNGSYLVGTETASTAIDIFRPFSPLLASGVTVHEGLLQNAVFPRVTTDVSGTWLSSESTSVGEVPPVLGAIAVTPKTWAVTARWSRQLQIQAPNMETFLRQTFARAAIQAVDTAALVGTDTLGQPLGLLNVAGVAAQSGTTYSHANSWTTRGTLSSASVTDQNIAWLGAPGVRTILAVRERAAGNGFVWEADQITGRGAQVSAIMPNGTLVCGDWSQLAYCFFGDGFQIDSTMFNSAADFSAGISAMRLMVSVDTFLQHPSAFVIVSAVT